MKNNHIKYNIIFLLFVVFIMSCNNKSSVNHEKGTTENKIKVGLFNGTGASSTCILETFESLKIDTGISTNYISSFEITEGKLNDFDVIIFPGGSASKELNNLGEKAAAEVVNFVNSGKGAVGICAGGYLFSTTKDYPSLKLVSATEWDRKHYNKGRALVEFELTEKGLEIFSELRDKNCFMQYYDGPVFMPADSGRSGTLSYNEMAKYVTDIKIHKGYPSGITPGKTFLLNENIGKGRAIVISGHPESTPGMRWMVPRMVRWAANKPVIEYNEKWVQPEIYTHEILFYTDLVKKEKSLFWDLLSDNEDRKIEAMQNLWELHSRPAVRWNLGLLRDSSPRVRALASELLKLAEYSAALPDLRAAYSQESNKKTKIKMESSIFHLSNY